MFLYRAILLHETFLLEKVTFLQIFYKPTGIDYQQINIYMHSLPLFFIKQDSNTDYLSFASAQLTS